MTTSVNVPANSVVIVAADGAIAPDTNVPTNAVSQVLIELVVDGSLPLNGGFRIVTASNSAFIGGAVPSNWSLSQSLSLSPGLHTIALQVENACLLCSGTFVGGSSGTGRQSEMTVTILNQ
jgi:hypothetical protein